MIGRKVLGHGAALLLSLVAIGVTVAFPSGSRNAGPDIGARLDLAFEIAPKIQPTAAVRAEAWSRVRGRVFTAMACVNDRLPRIGCGELPDVNSHVVSAAPIRSQSEEDEAALRLARRLNGLWKADGFALHVDGERAQANMDLNAPFEWERFLVKRVSDDTIVFSLGDELFQARLSAESVTLTGTALRDERVLTAVR